MDWDKTSEAFIGALIGAVLAYITTRIADRQKRHREAINDYRKNMIDTEIMLNAGLGQLFRNKRLLGNISKVSKEGGWMSSLPVRVDFDRNILHGVQNQQYGNEWLNLSLRTESLNLLVEDFREYYKKTGDEVHTMALHSDYGNEPEKTEKVLREDFESLAGFADSIHGITDEIIDQAILVYAACLVHSERDEKWRTKFRRLKKVGNFKVPEADRKRLTAKIRKDYGKHGNFKDFGTNIPAAKA